MNFYPSLCGGDASCRSTHQHLVWLKITWAKSRNRVMVCRFLRGGSQKLVVAAATVVVVVVVVVVVAIYLFDAELLQWINGALKQPSPWDATVGSCYHPGASYHSFRLNSSQGLKPWICDFSMPKKFSPNQMAVFDGDASHWFVSATESPFLNESKKELRMAKLYMDVSENRGTPKSSILIRVSIINNPFWGIPIFGKHPQNTSSHHPKSSYISTPKERFPSQSSRMDSPL